jgi:putative intracellular protease/amidase
MSTPRILHVVTNVAHYDDPAHATGLWLSELTHAWDVFAAQGYLQQLVSPLGGAYRWSRAHSMAALRCFGQSLAR